MARSLKNILALDPTTVKNEQLVLEMPTHSRSQLGRERQNRHLRRRRKIQNLGHLRTKNIRKQNPPESHDVNLLFSNFRIFPRRDLRINETMRPIRAYKFFSPTVKKGIDFQNLLEPRWDDGASWHRLRGSRQNWRWRVRNWRYNASYKSGTHIIQSNLSNTTSV